MPLRRPRRRPKTKKRLRRRHHRRAVKPTFKLKTVYLKAIQQLFPDRLMLRMRNNFTHTFAAAAGAYTAGGILGNGLHTPIAAATTGANSLAFNTATTIVGLGALIAAGGIGTAAPYYSYRIHSTTVSLRIQTANGGGIGNGGTFVLVPTTDYANFGNVNAFNEQLYQEYPFSKWVHIAGQTTNKGVLVKKSMSTSKMFGLKWKSSIEDSTYVGGYGNNPASLWGFIWAWFPDAANASPIVIDAQVTYSIEFFERSMMTAAGA